MNNYETMQAIGRGAYGNVYLYRRLSDHKQVVIKKIPLESITKVECELTKNEVRVLSMLQHPNIIEYYDNYLENNTMMIVMEYAPGGNLYDYLRSRGEGNFLQEEDVLHLFCQLVLGMQHIHESNILHRDIKSNNILLDRSHCIVKIGDFGISKILSSKSKAHTVVGTPCYLSPELCQEKPYNQKSDIWALGCVLYELLALKRAFEAETLPALIMKIMRGIFAPIHPHYSAEMRSLVHLLLHMDPAQRPNIQQVISHPLIFPTLFTLHRDLGMVRCISRPLRLSSVGTRTRSSRGSEDSTDKERTDIEKKTISEEIKCSEKKLPQSSAQAASVFCWSRLGTPLRLSVGNAEGEVVWVAASRTHRAGVTSAGQVVLWEKQEQKSKDIRVAVTENEDESPYKPTILRSPASVTVVQVSCGDGFIACVTDRGILLTSGIGSSGSLGHGNTSDVAQLRIVESLLGVSVKQVACGSAHVVAVSVDHQVYAWGCGSNGRLGIGSRMTQLWPQHVEIQYSEPEVTSIVAGHDCSFLVTTSGVLLASGSNRLNKLCVDETDLAGCETLKQIEDVATFVPVCSRPLANSAIIMVATGLNHSLFVTDAGEVFTCGKNTYGQLGHIGSQNPRVPARVMDPVARTQVTHVDCGEDFSVAVTQDGRIYSWGGKKDHKVAVDDPSKPKILARDPVGESARPRLVDLRQNIKGNISIAAADDIVIICYKA
ncbi:serine/threonine-protein kinase Nek8 [Procambarus clarkii]|uniref:serine/threonine-protein kinase Nek8 n=1 Tax=Procambarus clarkii TaxID=6728 RepID=UPI001E677E54|nr:serine/threonine-protein kinase Nek8-like [Procambarus clarkii]